MMHKGFIKISIAFSFIILIIASLKANETDSLLKLLKETHDAMQRIEIYFTISRSYQNTNSDTALFLAGEAISLSKKIGNKKMLGDLYGLSGDIYVTTDSLDQAKKYYLLALGEFTESENFQALSGVYTVLGNISMVEGNSSQAMQYYLNALKLSQEKGINRRIPFLNMNIGTIHYNAGNLTEAQKYYTSSLEGFEKVSDTLNIARTLSNIGLTYMDLNDDKLAEEYFKQALQLFLSHKAYTDLGVIYQNLAFIEANKGDYQNAVSLVGKSLDYLDLVDPNYAGPRIDKQAISMIALGQFYRRLKNLKEAHDWMLKAYKIGIKNNMVSVISESSLELSSLFEETNQSDSALFYLKIHLKNKVDLLNTEKVKKLASMEAELKYDQQLKEEELKRIEAEESQHRRNVFFIIAIVILLLVALVLLLFLQLGRNKVARMELYRQNLQNELELRNKELTTHVMTQLKKNEFILEITGKLEKTLADANPGNKPIIEKVIKELESDQSGEVWKEFEIRFTQVHSDFYKKLVDRFPDLSPNELRLCAFLKLNLNTKEISSITKQSVNSIDVARSRLRNKLGLNKEDNLVAFLTQF